VDREQGLKMITDMNNSNGQKEGQPITLVLLQVGLDVGTSAVCIAGLLFQQTNIYLVFCC
jgi:hypothetical protein